MRYPPAPPDWITRHGNPYSLMNPKKRKNLVGLWSAAVSRGRQLIDIGPNRLHGQFMNSPIPRVTRAGPSIYFSENDYIELASSGLGLFDVQEFTIFVITMPDTSGNINIYFSYEPTSFSPPHYCIQLRSDDRKLYFCWNKGTGNNARCISANDAVYDEKPQVIAATFISGDQRVYVNDELVTSNTYADTITFFDQEVWIGHGNLSQWDMFGDYMLLGFWSRCFKEPEILEMARNPWESLFRRDSIVVRLQCMEPGGLGTVQLDWTDVSSNEEGYLLQRRVIGDVWYDITTLAAGTNTYNDDPEKGHTYQYRVKAISSILGDSDWSNIAQITI